MRHTSNSDWRKLKNGILFSTAFIGLACAVKLSEYYTGTDLGQYGILPRTLKGTVGIFLSPLVHGDIYHLISNCLPLLLLGTSLFYFYGEIAKKIILIIYLLTGLGVWIAAREAYHIGASGIVYGLLAFLICSGFVRKDRNLLAISFAVLLLYGGSLFYGIIPNDPQVSWESHLMGALTGLLAALYYRKPRMVSDIDGKEIQTSVKAHYTYYFKSTDGSEKNAYTYTIDIKQRHADEKNTTTTTK